MRDALTSWQFQPGLTLALLVTAIIYIRGWRALHAQMPARFAAGRLSAFLAGLVAIFVAIASPLDAFAGLLLQVHMLQHLLLVMIAPPLLWIGAPAAPLLRGLPQRFAKSGLGPFLAWPALQGALRTLSHPIVAGVIFAVAMLAWHLPGPYQIALESPAWHQAEHLCFLVAGLLFWWPVVQPWPSEPVWPRWAMIPYLLFADLVNTILSAIFIFSERAIYPAYAAAPRLWGISPLEDQAMAGALMWVPGSIVFLLPAVLIVVEFASGRTAAASEQSRRHFGPRPAETPALPLRTFHDARARQRPGFDLLRAPVIGSFLRWRHGRRTLQLAMLLLAVAMIADGLLGPQMAPMNLAGVLPWTHWRALVVVGLLIGGNVFCMACPFTLPRELAKRLLPAQRAWPRRLRAKWLAAALLVLYLCAYETWALWDSPWWTAMIALAYFAAAFAIDGVFRGASFCKYVCPIGQFHFVQSLVSPLTLRPRSLDVCQRCTTHDCIRGNAHQRGCELDLFQPEKRGNLDCTFCLDCVAACPHDNVGILAGGAGARARRRPVPILRAPALRTPRHRRVGVAHRLRRLRQRRRHGGTGGRLAAARRDGAGIRVERSHCHSQPIGRARARACRDQLCCGVAVAAPVAGHRRRGSRVVRHRRFAAAHHHRPLCLRLHPARAQHVDRALLVSFPDRSRQPGTDRTAHRDRSRQHALWRSGVGGERHRALHRLDHRSPARAARFRSVGELVHRLAHRHARQWARRARRGGVAAMGAGDREPVGRRRVDRVSADGDARDDPLSAAATAVCPHPDRLCFARPIVCPAAHDVCMTFLPPPG